LWRVAFVGINLSGNLGFKTIVRELGEGTVDIDFSNYVSEGRGKFHDGNVDNLSFKKNLVSTADQFTGNKWMPLPSYPRRNCGYGNSLAFYANGDVSPCLSPRFIRGNVKKNGIQSVFDWVLSERENSFVDRLPECKTCDLRYVCGGRCHLKTLTKGLGISQVECPDSYKEALYNNLVKHFEAGQLV